VAQFNRHRIAERLQKISEVTAFAGAILELGEIARGGPRVCAFHERPNSASKFVKVGAGRSRQFFTDSTSGAASRSERSTRSWNIRRCVNF
jgi:hypothetical protein